MSPKTPSSVSSGAIPKTFVQYLKSFGPGIIVVLTWLGAGDIVEVGVAGGNFGYALMWVVALAVFMRFLFVSLIAKYQLCNQRGEGVLDGLARLNTAFPLLLFVAAIVMGHIYGAYMTVGIGEACVNLMGFGSVFSWALFWNAIAVAIVFRPIFGRIEWIFKSLLILLSISFLGTALWVGPNPEGVLQGTLAFKLPEKSGPYDSLLIAIGMIGAVGGSLMNLVYPYFLDKKGWNRPEHRRVQTYDFLFGRDCDDHSQPFDLDLGGRASVSKRADDRAIGRPAAIAERSIGKWREDAFLFGHFRRYLFVAYWPFVGSWLFGESRVPSMDQRGQC